jgi:hypothetical protein
MFLYIFNYQQHIDSLEVYTSPLANSTAGAGIISHHPALPVLVLKVLQYYDELAPFVTILYFSRPFIFMY